MSKKSAGPGTTLHQGSALTVQDIYLPLNHLFNRAAKHAFQFKVDKLFVTRELSVVSDTRMVVTDEVQYFGAKCSERQIFDAAQKVANTINGLADLGFVTGVMTKLILFPLATERHQLPEYLVLSYVALSSEGMGHLKKNPVSCHFDSGAIPEEI